MFAGKKTKRTLEIQKIKVLKTLLKTSMNTACNVCFLVCRRSTEFWDLCCTYDVNASYFSIYDIKSRVNCHFRNLC